MSSEERVKAELCAGSFCGCLVEGDAEQNARERKIKRRAIVVSILLQSTALAVFVIAPLFAKPAELTGRIVVPVPPYRSSAAPRQAAQPPTGTTHIVRCLHCFEPFRIPPTVPTLEREEEQGPPEIIGSITNSSVNADPHGLIGIPDTRPQRPQTEEVLREKKRIHESHIDPALLTRRIEPVFPPLARQTRRSGKVELHALIGTDGSVQELQVVSGDPLFIPSALEAVRQWHYRPTYLNGQPVEIDTFITVIYTLQ
jgi:periplasmic protein TonB